MDSVLSHFNSVLAREELNTPTLCLVPSYHRLDPSLAKEAYIPISRFPLTPQDSLNFIRLIRSILKKSSSAICQARATAGKVARGCCKPKAEYPSRRTDAVNKYLPMTV